MVWVTEKNGVKGFTGSILGGFTPLPTSRQGLPDWTNTYKPDDPNLFHLDSSMFPVQPGDWGYGKEGGYNQVAYDPKTKQFGLISGWQQPDTGGFMDWLAPASLFALPVLGGLAGLGTSASAPAASAGAAATGTGAAATGATPLWAPSLAGTTFNTSMGLMPSIMEAQTMAGAGLTAAEMAQLGVSPTIAAISGYLPTITGPNPLSGGGILGNASKLPTSLLNGLGGGQQQQQSSGGGGGSSGPALWPNSATALPYSVNFGTPNYQPFFQSPYKP